MSHLGQQIIQARKNKGISQEQLAEDSKINLRTIQRMEKGETTPHGDTLKRISEALGVPLEDLINYGYVEDYGYIKAMHFTTLVFLLLPLGNILLPLIFWLVKKDQIKDLSYFAKKLMNFQITWSIITYLPIFFSIIAIFARGQIHFPEFIENHSNFLTWYLLPLMYLINIIYIIISGILIKDKRRNFFPISIPLLR
jgi:transcriptional regulator with XRE-family HTH domain